MYIYLYINTIRLWVIIIYILSPKSVGDAQASRARLLGEGGRGEGDDTPRRAVAPLRLRRQNLRPAAGTRQGDRGAGIGELLYGVIIEKGKRSRRTGKRNRTHYARREEEMRGIKSSVYKIIYL